MQPSETYTGPPNMGPPPEIPQQKPTFLLVISIFTAIISILLIFFAKKKPKLKWISLALFVAALIFGIIYITAKPSDGIKPSKAPKIIEEKIQGFWEPDLAKLNLALENDIEKIKDIGINTIAITPQFNDEGHGHISEFAGTDQEIKKAINKAHKNGMRVMIDVAPTPTGYGPMGDNSYTFERNMRKIILKYAKIAEGFNVEYFSPLSEPATHMSVESANKFMKDMLSEVNKRYTGKIVYQKSSQDPQSTRELNQDHIVELEFMLTGELFGVGTRVSQGENASQYTFSIHNDRFSLNKSSGSEKRRILKEHTETSLNTWYTLRIEQKGKTMTFYLDGEKIIQHDDTQNTHGGLILNAGGVKVKNITLVDLKGNSLIGTGHIGNNWSSDEGWTIDENELIGIENPVDPDKIAGQLTLVNGLDFSGYDILAINLYTSDFEKDLSEYRRNVKSQIENTKNQASASEIPEVIVGKFGGANPYTPVWEMENDRKNNTEKSLTNWELADIAKVVLEEAEGNTSGYFYNGWETEGYGINKIPEVERVIKSWYTSH